MIPERFIRVWLGPKAIPPRFEEWWGEFKRLHRGWEFVTLREGDVELSSDLLGVYRDTSSWAGKSDVLRWAALHQLGGVYVDTDVMPIKSFEPLRTAQPFIGASQRGLLETSIVGSPPGHEAVKALVDALPEWYWDHFNQPPNYATGPHFVDAVWRDRSDVTIVSPATFDFASELRRTPGARQVSNWMISALTSGAYAAHYCAGSWRGTKQSTKSRRRY